MGAAVAMPLVGASAEPAPRTRRVEGRVALVTGSSRNLGRATVLELARRGADVVVNGRSNEAEAEATAVDAAEFGVRAIHVMADVGIEEQVEAMVEVALDRMGRVDILINNAGYRGANSFVGMTTEEWRTAAAVNFDGPFYCTRAVVPSMIENGYGRIITVSGLNSWHGRAGWAHICGSKMGAVGMTRALAAELGPSGILVNHVVPGAFLAHPDPESIPVPRIGTAEELANVYAFLDKVIVPLLSLPVPQALTSLRTGPAISVPSELTSKVPLHCSQPENTFHVSTRVVSFTAPTKGPSSSSATVRFPVSVAPDWTMDSVAVKGSVKSVVPSHVPVRSRRSGPVLQAEARSMRPSMTARGVGADMFPA
jgi:3-oxoacyl-[acyl-carrier protein] reductase